MKQKGQITVFVILGLVLIFVISFILYAVNISSQNKLEAQADQSIDDFLHMNAIDTYITYCLEEVTKEGLETALSQGGYIYNTQDPKSPYSTPKSQEGKTYLPYQYMTMNLAKELKIHSVNVSYGIVEPVPCFLYVGGRANLSDESTSYYPLKDEWLRNYVYRYNKFYPSGCLSFSFSDTRFSGFLGGYNFPALCSYDGENSLETSALCRADQYDFETKPNALQRQLESYVESNLPKCTNFSFFADMGTNVTPNFDNVNATLFFKNPTGLVVKAKYEFNVSVGGSDPFTRNVEFMTEIDGSFKQLHNYIQELFINLLKDPYFNLTRDWNNSQLINSYKKSFSLTVDKQVCLTEEGCKFGISMDDDIYTFVDTAYTLLNKPLKIMVAVQNRRPILDYIHDSAYSNNILGFDVDKQYYTNATMYIDPLFVDPDGDSVDFKYFGWKQTYDNYLDKTCCEDTDKVNWGGGCNLSNHRVCLEKKPMNLSNSLMNSTSFLASNKSINYKLNESDLGYHNITLVITDQHGLKDFQIIKILVFDLPKAVLNVSNIFDDINNHFASVEDLFLLNASGSQASEFVGGDISKIILMDSDEPFVITNKTQMKIYTPNESYVLENYTEGWFKSENLHPLKSKQHLLSLIVSQNVDGGRELQSPPDFQTINVSECLPHGYISSTGIKFINRYGFNPDQKSTWPYPFQDNYETAPHVCCVPFDESKTLTNLSGGEFAGISTTCFEKETTILYPFKEFGEYDFLDVALAEKKGVAMNSTLSVFDDPSYYASAKPGDDGFNDIYTFELKQKCSGDRGNICSGKFSKTIKKIDSCSDLDQIDNQFARCQIPATPTGLHYTYFQAGESVNDAVCKDLNGPSFEYIFYTSLDDDLKKSFLSDLGLSETEENLFLKGYCGPEEKFKIEDELIQSNSGYYTCLPECDDAYGCNYGLNTCVCNLDYGSDTCQGINANDFGFIGGTIKVHGLPIPIDYQATNYVCVDNNAGEGACTYDCGFKNWETTPEGCYCKDEGSTIIPINPENSDRRDKIDYFFSGTGVEAVGFNGAILPAGFACCSNDVAIYKHLANEDNWVCYDGDFYKNELISNNLLAFGEIWYCDVLDSPAQLSISQKVSPGIRKGDYICKAGGKWELY